MILSVVQICSPIGTLDEDPSMKVSWEALRISLALTTVQLQDHLITIAIHMDGMPAAVADIHIRQVQDLVTSSEVTATCQDSVHNLRRDSSRNLVSSNYIPNALGDATLARELFESISRTTMVELELQSL